VFDVTVMNVLKVVCI